MATNQAEYAQHVTKFLAELEAARAPKPAPPPVVRPEPTQRQLDKITAEQEAGKARIAFYEAQGRPQRPPDPNGTTAVFRPRDFTEEKATTGRHGKAR